MLVAVVLAKPGMESKIAGIFMGIFLLMGVDLKSSAREAGVVVRVKDSSDG